jgi:hypothetical protein
LEDLSDASFLGKLLVLPVNVRLDWKVIARYKHSSLFGLFISNEGKKFYYIDTSLVIFCQEISKELPTKNTFASTYKLAKLELCSNHFSGLLCQTGGSQ